MIAFNEPICVGVLTQLSMSKKKTGFSSSVPCAIFWDVQRSMGVTMLMF